MSLGVAARWALLLGAAALLGLALGTLQRSCVLAEHPARVRHEQGPPCSPIGGARCLAAPAPPREIRVLLMTEDWFEPGTWNYSQCNPCEFRGAPLVCRIGGPEEVDYETAHALWFHAPHLGYASEFPLPAFPGQSFVLVSFESTVNTPHMADPEYAARFDVTIDYRLNSSLPVVFEPFDVRRPPPGPALPGFGERAPALLYMASNCITRTGRDELVAELAELGVPLVAPGKCQHNTDEDPTRQLPADERANVKLEWARRHRVCVAMENSITEDYVTEKVWDAFAAGCVPVYDGPPNALSRFLPARDAAILVGDFDSPDALAAEIQRALTNRTHWQRYMAWKRRPWEQLSPGYRDLLTGGYLTFPNDVPRCRLCQLLAERQEAGGAGRRQQGGWRGAGALGRMGMGRAGPPAAVGSDP